jgi:PKD repeat protein
VRVGAGIEFDSSCSTGVATSILWDVRLDTMPGVVLAQSPDPKYVYVFEREGMYTITLTIRDEFGNQSTDTIQITVSP